jgi:hypothetical protein
MNGFIRIALTTPPCGIPRLRSILSPFVGLERRRPNLSVRFAVFALMNSQKGMKAMTPSAQERV